MCGLDAAYTGLRIARELGVGHATILGTSVSSDSGTSAAKRRGYGAAALTRPPRTRIAEQSAAKKTATTRFAPLTAAEQSYLLTLARSTLVAYAKTGRLPETKIPRVFRICLKKGGCS